MGLRFEQTVLDDTGQSLGTGSRRLLGESSAEWFKDSTTAPVPGRTGPYLTLGLRLQFELP